MLHDFRTMLARWECTLNIWEWPKDMPFKPNDWDSLSHFSTDKTKRTRFTVSDRWMKLFEFLAGEKECLRWWHVNEIGTTEAEFEKWWLLRNMDY